MKNFVFVFLFIFPNLVFAKKCNWSRDFWDSGGYDVLWGLGLILAVAFGIRQFMKLLEKM